ncbi:acetyl-coa hydrolase-related [Anaeramoeba flamelloides]|uniref:Acetyl-coa hydrolase-related n=1 Tax=Anaeramoeba flamelloides TaxID=1746091 RepID=A0AAV7ZFM3_9EUKA|nr:acetyl-coa hydrolase-related [Anaeramoeba flamelloides]KAJ6244293.1 acetyl-coa hydrolase-related [Anaeramoeba flamelloides]
MLSLLNTPLNGTKLPLNICRLKSTLKNTLHMPKYVSPQQAVSTVKNGDHIYCHSISANPQRLISALVDRAPELSNVKLYHIHMDGPTPYADPKHAGTFFVNNHFIGGTTRHTVDKGYGSYIPCFLSEIPKLYYQGVIRPDYCFLNLSPPDKHGYCSLGVDTTVALSAARMAKKVIAQINPNMPRALGDCFVHLNDIDLLVESDDPLPEFLPGKVGETEKKIGQHLAEIIEDGATLQMGFGAIPDTVLNCLHNHKDLGVHTEMFAEGVIDLVEEGVITNKLKNFQPGFISATFVMGSNRMYNFLDNNPGIYMQDCMVTNDPRVISQNPKVTAINSAIEVDITGQVCSDSIGLRMYSGVGGQRDFEAGAAMSKGGKPIITLPSITKRGQSRIVNFLKPGAGVVTSRHTVHYIATEYGVVNIFGKNLHERARLLISIAHPSHRERLAREASERWNTLIDWEKNYY